MYTTPSTQHNEKRCNFPVEDRSWNSAQSLWDNDVKSERGGGGGVGVQGFFIKRIANLLYVPFYHKRTAINPNRTDLGRKADTQQPS